MNHYVYVIPLIKMFLFLLNR